MAMKLFISKELNEEKNFDLHKESALTCRTYAILFIRTLHRPLDRSLRRSHSEDTIDIPPFEQTSAHPTGRERITRANTRAYGYKRGPGLFYHRNPSPTPSLRLFGKRVQGIDWDHQPTTPRRSLKTSGKVPTQEVCRYLFRAEVGVGSLGSRRIPRVI